ncbi:DUF5717 family protein [Hungatella hathewayi]
MRERINRLAKGIIDSEVPVIKVTPKETTDVVRSGGATRRELVVTSENNLHIKGLAYSSNFRVRLLNGAFGGTYNHLVYEVNTSFLEDGDVIKGAFYLVTNGGEREVPYSFRVELSTSGKALSDLKTAEDFAATAKNDYETALRLFEYRDFYEAPFMKDLHVRALYGGLKGRPDRKKELEEFLTGLGVKEPVKLSADESEWRFDEPAGVIEECITVTRSCWGYVSLEVTADCDFIEIPVRNIGDQDFTDDICEIVYRIHPGRMHQGLNQGRIIITGIEERFVVPVTAMVNPGGGISAEDAYTKEAVAAYLHLRLQKEAGEYEEAVLLVPADTDEGDVPHNRMLRALDEIEEMKGQLEAIKLLRAEIYLSDGRERQAALLMDECREKILAERQEKLELYCYYQYLRLILQPDEYQKESLVRLLRKYLEENPDLHNLFLILLKLDRRMSENPGGALSMMRRQFEAGMRSPFLYLHACRLLSEEPDLIRSIGPFELQVLSFGARYGAAGKEFALAAARLTLTSRHFNRLHYRALGRLYEKYPEKEILEAVCSILIRGESRSAESFKWYEKGIKEGISLTRLYEYYLYALPKDYRYLLPKEVLLYFSYGGSELDRHSRALLYKNVLVYLKESDPLYEAYERDIEKFATEQLFESRIGSNLAVIYEHMIYKDVIDLPMAKVLPSILRSYRVECKNVKMKYVIVCYEELQEEDAFLLDDGVAYVPLFSEHSILLFQDAFGNRYSTVPYEKTPVMDKPDLEARCFELYPDHPMLRLRACDEVLKRGIADEKEAEMLEDAMEDGRLQPLYQRLLLSRIIEYYQHIPLQAADEDSSGGDTYLVRLDKRLLTKEERQGICETLISRNYIEEAFDMIREFGCEDIQSKRLLKLCTRMILKNLFDEDPLLLHLSYRVFLEGMSDSVILDYLCEHYNGLTNQMYRVLLQGISEHVETYDLEERLVAQMMFSGCTETIDRVFSLYMNKKKTSDNIVRAYFTIKSSEYFLEDKTPDDKVFAYLEGAVNSSADKERIPTIYLLALTKYYSELSSLEEEQKELLRSTTAVLLEAGLVFPYFKTLAKYVPMPEDIMDKAMIQYHSDRNARIDFEVRILPDEEEYHCEDIGRTYQGIFVKKKVLFEGEIMEYRISELEDGQWVLKKEGSVSCDAVSAAGDTESRFACLNEMSLCLSLKDEEGLKKRMREYLTKNAAAEELFPLM